MTHHDMLKRMYYAQADSQPRPAVALSLADWTGYADTGQQVLHKVTTATPTPTIYKGKECCEFIKGTFLYVPYKFSYAPSGTGGNHIDRHNCLCVWAACASNTNWRASTVVTIGGLNTAGNSTAHGFGVFYNASPSVNSTAFIASNIVINASRTLGPQNTNWHHYAINYRSIDPMWDNADFTIDAYIDGVFMGSHSFHGYNNIYDCVFMANTHTNGITQYMRDIRAFNQELTADQIQQIYQEGL